MYAIEQKSLTLVETILRTVEPDKVKNVVKTQAFDGSSCLKIAESLKSSFDVNIWNKLWNSLQSAASGQISRFPYTNQAYWKLTSEWLSPLKMEKHYFHIWRVSWSNCTIKFVSHLGTVDCSFMWWFFWEGIWLLKSEKMSWEHWRTKRVVGWRFGLCLTLEKVPV